MKCLRDTSAPLCPVKLQQERSAPFTDLCLLNPLHCHCSGSTPSVLPPVLSLITTRMVGQRDIDCAGTEYWHFYGHDFVLLPLKCICFKDGLYFHDYPSSLGHKMMEQQWIWIWFLDLKPVSSKVCQHFNVGMHACVCMCRFDLLLNVRISVEVSNYNLLFCQFTRTILTFTLWESPVCSHCHKHHLHRRLVPRLSWVCKAAAASASLSLLSPCQCTAHPQNLCCLILPAQNNDADCHLYVKMRPRHSSLTSVWRHWFYLLHYFSMGF